MIKAKRVSPRLWGRVWAVAETMVASCDHKRSLGVEGAARGNRVSLVTGEAVSIVTDSASLDEPANGTDAAIFSAWMLSIALPGILITIHYART